MIDAYNTIIRAIDDAAEARIEYDSLFDQYKDDVLQALVEGQSVHSKVSELQELASTLDDADSAVFEKLDDLWQECSPEEQAKLAELSDVRGWQRMR